MKFDINGAKYFLVSFFLGAFALSLFSILPQYIVGAVPPIFTVFIVQVLLGGSIGVILAIVLRRIKSQNSCIQEALRESEERFRTLFDKAPLAMAYISMDGKIISLNNPLREMMGYETEDIPTLEHAWTQSMPDLDLRERVSSKWLADLEQAVKNNSAVESFECPLVYKDGSQHIAVIGTKFIDKNILVSFYDITEKKKTEEALRASESKLRSIIETMTDSILILDTEGRFQEFVHIADKIMSNLSQDELDELLYTPLEEAFSPEKAAEFREAVHKALSLDTPTSIEFERTVAGHESCFEGIFSRLSSDRVVMVSRDITDRKKFDEALQESERRFRLIFQTSPESIILTRLDDGLIVDINESHTQMTGYSREELIGQTALESGIWDDPADREKLVEHLRKTGIFTSWEVPFARKGDSVGTALASGRIIHLKGVPHILAISRDITDQKREQEEKEKLQVRLRQSQKMEAVGTLAGGIAHDFNNILTIILGNIHLARKKEPSGSLTPEINSINSAAMRAIELVKHILTFSRQTEAVRQPVDTRSIIIEAMKMMRASLPSTMEIEQRLEPNLPRIMADPTHIHQIIINLCTNAAHAIGRQAGLLTVVLEKLTVAQDDELYKLDIPPGEYIRLCVSDTGKGMDRKTQERIFEPYFTTKEKGEGTGLGLATVHGIVQGYNGAIKVYSELGRGAGFSVYLPAVKQGGECPTEDESVIFGKGERILFVDDEEGIVASGAEILEGLGYQVDPCNSSRDALELFSSRPGQYNLVITDYTMPKMNGVELAREILRIKSDIGIILCTGFSRIPEEEEANFLGLRNYVAKPFRIAALSKTIRRVLDGETDK